MRVNTQDARFDARRVGRWSGLETFNVTRDRLVAYARATNDDIREHATGELASPAFAFVIAFELFSRELAKLVPPAALTTGVHGGQSFWYHRPIEPGMTLLSRAEVTGFTPRSSGTTVSLCSRSTTESGEPVVDQDFTCFFRGVHVDAAVGEEPAQQPLASEPRDVPPLARVAHVFDLDQTRRYADASGDRAVIHLDDAAARRVGLSSTIIHGLCTLAFAARALLQSTCPEDPTALCRLAVRFSRPCYPGQATVTSIWHVQPGRYAFEMANDSGEAVLRDGWATVRS